MSRQLHQERKIKRTLFAVIIAIFGLFVGQVFIYKYRLYAVNAVDVVPVLKSEECDDKNCKAVFELTPTAKFLLLGHVMRYHSVFRNDDGVEIYPVSALRGVANESWTGLRVYPVEADVVYRLEATKPKAVKMGYFVGIRPRSTDHEGILSVPDITPTISVVTTMAGLGVLGILIFAAILGIRTSPEKSHRFELWIVIISALFSVISSSISSGMIASLLPDGEFRSRLLRTCLFLSLVSFPISSLKPKYLKSRGWFCFVALLSFAVAINYYWPLFRAGPVWSAAVAIGTMSLSLSFAFRRKWFCACFAVIGLYDPLYQLNWIAIPDFPPIYMITVMSTASWSFLAADLGAVSVISLASRAYHRFTRDIALTEISALLGERTETKSSDIADSIKEVLPKISRLTRAQRVSILINLPFGRPIIHIFDAVDQTSVTHDDGKIPGAVTIRAFVYGDEAWFEPYSEFAKRLGLAQKANLKAGEFICVAPIRVHNNNTGVLMLTCFDDDEISGLIKNELIEDEKETGRLLLDTLSSSFSRVLIGNMEANSELAVNLLSRVREAIPMAPSTSDFFRLYCESVADVTGLRAMLHRWEGNKGVAITQAGFVPHHWHHFVNAPFNLSSSTNSALGPTVVAFRERKSSYLKDWIEINDKLHPKTVDILTEIAARTFLAVPLRSGDQQFVLTLISNRGDPPKDPGIMKIVESTEAIFDAAATVLNQRTSVLALGKLANRLIGDDDVRNRIIEAAKQEILPTTIGTPRTSFLLLFDLVGSSLLPADTEEKARSYGVFYDEVNLVAQQRLGGKIRKTIGDAVIVTWDGTNVDLEDNSDLINALRIVSVQADRIARQVGCKGIRAVLHHGDYFFGLIGTSSFGQIDVIGKGIDDVCKMEGRIKGQQSGNRSIKVAVSRAAAEKLTKVTQAMWDQGGFINPDSHRSGDALWSQGLAWISFSFDEKELPDCDLDSLPSISREVS